MLRELRKKEVKHGFYHQLLAIDIENNTKTGDFICAGIYGYCKYRTSTWCLGKPRVIYKNELIEKYIDNETEFEDFILSLKANSCMLVFFNLAYDKAYFNNLLAPITKDSKGNIKYPVLRSGSRIISITLKNGIKGLDLCNHVDGSLENWIKYLDMKSKYNIEKVSLDNLYNRVMNDVKATYYLGEFIQNFYFNEIGIPLQLTVGASALRLFQQKYFTDYWIRNDDFLSIFERQAYYGGRTELFRKGKFYTYNYDVNSMYLSIMRDCLIPDVSTTKYIENGKNYKNHFDDYLGIYHCRVKAPKDIYIPVLPVKHEGKLKFPKGEFEGTWCSTELKKAIEKGYKIIKVYDYIYYRQAKPYFSEFAKFVWSKRAEYKAKGNKGMDLMIKKIGNSLYGKFAQRNASEFFGKLTELDQLPEVCELIDNGDGEIWIRVTGEKIPASFEFPAISAFITSYARLKLYSGIEANEEAMIYCDTDSLKLLAPAKSIDIGKDLGQFGFEGNEEIEFFKPKFYFDETQKDVNINKEKLETSSNEKSFTGYKCKGVPKRAEVIERTPDYVKFKYLKPLKEREAVRRKSKPNIWVEVVKIATFEDDKRKWKKDGTSEPLTINN